MTPERQRIRRIRWSMTAFFTIATALSLTVFALIAASIDNQSRTQQTDQELMTTAEQLIGTATWSDTFTFDRFGVQSWTTIHDHFAFIDDAGIAVASPDQDGLPPDHVIATLVATVHRTGRSAFVTAPAGATQSEFRWTTRAYPFVSEPVVLVGTPIRPIETAHQQLVIMLTLVAVGLTIGGAMIGHLLSGLAMRPALRSIAQQEQFLREAAHELRTPLATMRLGVAGVPDPDAPAALRRVAEQVRRMSDLTDRLLARARLRGADTAEIVLIPLRLDQLVERAIEEHPNAEHVTVSSTPSIIRGHPELITQLVRNLVENAVTHGAPPVRVVVGHDALTVADSGPGIGEHRRQRVLRPGGSSGSGTGTGLAIVAWITTAHGAELRLGAAVSGGLEVAVQFPARVNSNESTSPRSTSTAHP
jgi:two-component system OmpR family sensor kinase